ncbi:hypothetical protein BVRB_014880 [Beta vulgaris subsp. vulgaris]|uniref:Uncharacterized protein n=1 Tax=Beta vulgaris subsp. vulgaris TaxID=3555 RepID=A0A0J8B1E2_BETVV|nr:hypothetical protein BVRB_014880 [Beta vulgaris subsp. vulgaris]
MASEWNLNDAWSPSDYDDSDNDIAPEGGDLEHLGFQLDMNEAQPASTGDNEEAATAHHNGKSGFTLPPAPAFEELEANNNQLPL